MERSVGFEGPSLGTRRTLRFQSTVYASASVFCGYSHTQASRSRSKNMASDPSLLTSPRRRLRSRWRAICLRIDQCLSMPSRSQGWRLFDCVIPRHRDHRALWPIYENSPISVRRRTSFIHLVTLVLGSFREKRRFRARKQRRASDESIRGTCFTFEPF